MTILIWRLSLVTLSLAIGASGALIPEEYRQLVGYLSGLAMAVGLFVTPRLLAAGVTFTNGDRS